MLGLEHRWLPVAPGLDSEGQVQHYQGRLHHCLQVLGRPGMLQVGFRRVAVALHAAQAGHKKVVAPGLLAEEVADEVQREHGPWAGPPDVPTAADERHVEQMHLAWQVLRMEMFARVQMGLVTSLAECEDCAQEVQRDGRS